MEQSTVYFTNMRTPIGTSLLKKMERLLTAAHIQDIDFDQKFTAIKMHFGEPGNLSFLRPNFAKTVVDTVKNLGGRPFLTDCNTLYVGRRKNALEHLDAAMENGFSPLSTGCQILIADGLRGTDEQEVCLTGTEYVKSAKIGRAIMDADVFISLTHFKGHENTGFGGALKNIGMGCGSRAGKMEQHNEGKPEVHPEKCRGCRACSKVCAHNAISYGDDHKATICSDRCVGCGRCIGICNFDAIDNWNVHSNDILCKKIAEYALAVVKDRPQFHISVVMQVSPNCDCHSENDLPIIPDVGIFASTDPVALDTACADMCNQMPVMPGSQLEDRMHASGCDHHDHFVNSAPETNWRVCLEHAEKIGVGTRNYQLVTVK